MAVERDQIMSHQTESPDYCACSEIEVRVLCRHTIEAGQRTKSGYIENPRYTLVLDGSTLRPSEDVTESSIKFNELPVPMSALNFIFPINKDTLMGCLLEMFMVDSNTADAELVALLLD
ncbi:hypothetical protein GJ496_003158 [Pomphorhynchus laevis]|nr:hypothetical protein GJ496_003158 [Pomphorhynchus laevis]